MVKSRKDDLYVYYRLYQAGHVLPHRKHDVYFEIWRRYVGRGRSEANLFSTHDFAAELNDMDFFSALMQE